MTKSRALMPSRAPTIASILYIAVQWLTGCAPSAPPNANASSTLTGSHKARPIETGSTSPAAPGRATSGSRASSAPALTGQPSGASQSSESSSLRSIEARVHEGASIQTLLQSEAAVLAARMPTIENPSLDSGVIRLAVGGPDGAFGELTRRGLARNVRNGELLVRLPKDYPTSHDAAAARYLACSYVIDCDAPEVRSLGHGELPSAPSVLALVSLVGRHISVKSLARGFDVASEVAASREGDCSEHAVLLAALARHHRLAARVVFGLAVLEFERRPVFVGHAWTEVHDGKRWLLADAALHGIEHQRIPNLLRVHYLPISLLEHEGVDFQAKLLTTPNAFSIHRIEAGL